MWRAVDLEGRHLESSVVFWPSCHPILAAARRGAGHISRCACNQVQEVSPGTGPISTQLITSTLAFLEALGLQRPNLLGWSLGGSVALMVLQEAPQAVGKVQSAGAACCCLRARKSVLRALGPSHRGERAGICSVPARTPATQRAIWQSGSHSPALAPAGHHSGRRAA